VVGLSLIMAFFVLTFRWDLLGMWVRPVASLLFVVCAWIGYKRVGGDAPASSRLGMWSGIIVQATLIVLFAGLMWRTTLGFEQPAGAMDVRSPLRDGAAVVLHGGSSPFMNAHARVWPQNFAIDIVGLNGSKRSRSLSGSSSDLKTYELFGQAVYSPCAGMITAASDGLEDLVPPAVDQANPTGNHVMIDCDGVEFLLAHLQQFSVVVEIGDVVTTSSIVGRVGNTGNTSEPHLHMHAERGGPIGTPLDGEPVPFTIDGKWLVRGSTALR